MAGPIKNQFEIDAQQAIATINRLQQAFLKYNSTVGQMASQQGSFNNVADKGRITFTQIDTEGRKVSTTIREVGNAYQVLSTKVGAATASQRNAAAALEKQRQLADALAKQVAGRAAGGGVTTPTTTPGVDPRVVQQSVTALAGLTAPQVAAAAAANNLNAAQTRALQNIVVNAAKAKGALLTLQNAGTTIQNKFNEIGKIAFATAIYRSISLLQLALTEGGKSAVEFSRQIGLIQTLTKSNADDFGSWSASIRAVADEFGRPVIEVATATYDALSNQVIKTTKDMDLLRSSTELARNTNSTTTAALEVSSSILNTYGSAAGTAQEIVDKLFVTVDLGRVRVNELNGVIGRSTSLAKTAGVGFNELAAGLTVLTQQGLKSEEAATLLNNIFIQLIKPNKDLAEQLRTMGFASGEAAVETLGFVGVMDQLTKASKNSSEGLATFFPEIRGLRGVAGITSDLDKFKEALDAITKASGANAAATAVLNKNIGQKLADEMQRIKNFFTVDIGQKALETVAGITGAFGGLNNIIKFLGATLVPVSGLLAGLFLVSRVSTFASAVVTVISNFSALQLTINAATGAQLGFNGALAAALGPAGIFIATFAGAYIAIDQALKALDRAAQEQSRIAGAQFEEQRRLSDEAAVKEAEVRVSEFEKSADRMVAIYGRFTAEATKLNDKFVEEVKSKNSEMEGSLRNTFDILLGIQRKNISALEKEQEKASSNLTKIDEIKSDTIAAQEQASFEARIKHYQDYQKRINDAARRGGTSPEFVTSGKSPLQLANEAVEERNNVLSEKIKIQIDQGDLHDALALFKEVQANVAKLKDFHGTFGVEQAQLENLRIFISLLDEAKNKQAETDAEKNQQILGEQKRLKDLEDIFKKLATYNTKAFTTEGTLVPKFAADPSKAITGLKALQTQALQLTKTTKGLDDPNLLKKFGLTAEEIVRQFQEQQSLLQNLIAGAQRGQALTASFEARKKAFEAEKALMSDLNKTIVEQTKLINANAEASQKLAANIANTSKQTVIAPTAGSLNTLKALTGLVSAPDLASASKAAAAIDPITKSLNTLLAQTNKNVPAIRQQINLLEEAIKPLKELSVVDPSAAQSYITYKDAVDRLRSSISIISDAQEKQKKAQNDVATTQDAFKSLSQSTQDAIASIPGLSEIVDKEVSIGSSSSGVSEAARQFRDLRDAMDSARSAAEQLQAVGPIAPKVTAPTGGGGVEEHAKGGVAGSQFGWLSDFLSGKFAKGSDQIPAMLTRGEFVVRAPMAEKFYSQLVAINSNRFPIYRSEGGSVTNSTTVGDMHISVSGGQSSAQFAKEVMGHLRRAAKQGRFNLQ